MMNPKKILAVLVVFVTVSACRDQTPFATVEGALHELEAAYRDGDIERAIAAKDFHAEARVILFNIGGPDLGDEALVEKTADALELAFRKEIEQSGFPDFDQLDCREVARQPFEHFPDIWVVTEDCFFPDGGQSRQEILMSKRPDGWRVMNPIK
jgi:hypothetical protein